MKTLNPGAKDQNLCIVPQGLVLRFAPTIRTSVLTWHATNADYLLTYLLGVPV